MARPPRSGYLAPRTPNSRNNSCVSWGGRSPERWFEQRELMICRKLPKQPNVTANTSHQTTGNTRNTQQSKTVILARGLWKPTRADSLGGGGRKRRERRRTVSAATQGYAQEGGQSVREAGRVRTSSPIRMHKSKHEKVTARRLSSNKFCMAAELH
jgi:hypothetical protein